MSPLTPHDIGLLTLPEAAKIAEVSPVTVRVWIGRYKLPTVRVQGRVMISEMVLYDCERARRNTPQGRSKRAKVDSE